MGRGGDGEMGRGGQGKKKDKYYQLPITNAQSPMPNPKFPIPYSLRHNS
ncbi:MAG: histidine kinase [Rivularia sp. (in: cyanobacteria)]